jgi:hypothetical protein
MRSELPFSGRARVDKDLLALGSYETIDMVTPETFLHILRNEKL